MAKSAAAIEAAKKSLKLKEILILNIAVNVSDSISEKDGDTDARVAYRHGCVAHKLLGTDDDRTVRFKYQCGLRLADNNLTEKTSADELEEKDVMLEIKATYAVDYNMREPISEDELIEFGVVNVGYHVWPFWREFVQSTCSRVGVTTIPLPFYNPPKPPKKAKV